MNIEKESVLKGAEKDELSEYKKCVWELLTTELPCHDQDFMKQMEDLLERVVNNWGLNGFITDTC